MRNRVIGSILTVMAAFAFSLSLLAQTPARPAGGGTQAKPDLSGIWDSGGRVRLAGPGAFGGGARDSLGGVPAAGFTKEEPSMQPSALRIYRARREGLAPNNRGLEAGDPAVLPQLKLECSPLK